MTAKPPTLAEVQARFQAAILSGERGLLGLIPSSSRASAKTLLGVYTRGYGARLLGVVRSDHPVLAAYVGEARFEELVRGYLAQHPSRSPNARWVSDALPLFLRQAVPEEPWLAEIADLERALNLAFDAADAPMLNLAGLAALAPPEKWGELSFTLHPSTRLLSFTTNAHEIWRAVRAGESPPPVLRAHLPSCVLVSRGTAGVVQRAVTPEEAMMWGEAARGAQFGALCELAAVFDDAASAPMRAAQYLAAWLESGALTAAALVNTLPVD